MLSLIKSRGYLRGAGGAAPCGVKLILDGEEERGSPNLPAFVDRYARPAPGAMRALSFDGGIDARGVPKIGLGTSGMLYVELSAPTGARHELHSARRAPVPRTRRGASSGRSPRSRTRTSAC